jgi:hypothetical protein
LSGCSLFILFLYIATASSSVTVSNRPKMW